MEDEEETAEEEGTERNLETGGSWPPCRQRGSAGFRSLCCAANSYFASYFSDGEVYGERKGFARHELNLMISLIQVLRLTGKSYKALLAIQCHIPRIFS